MTSTSPIRTGRSISLCSTAKRGWIGHQRLRAPGVITDAESDLIKHFSGCPFLKELQKEAMVHNFEITDKVLRVESKDKIKVRLGSSPDIMDATLQALWVALRKEPVGFRVRTA